MADGYCVLYEKCCYRYAKCDLCQEIDHNSDQELNEINDNSLLYSEQKIEQFIKLIATIGGLIAKKRSLLLYHRKGHDVIHVNNKIDKME